MIDATLSLFAAESLSSRALARYLHHTGWMIRPSHAQGVAVFSRKLTGTEEPVEFILPLQRPAPDEIRRVADALRTLTVVEDRSLSEIVRDAGAAGDITAEEYARSVADDSSRSAASAPVRLRD